MSIDVVGSSLRQGLMERLFQRADIDRNQSVTTEELASFLPEGGSGTAGAIIGHRDQDGDGQLSMAEFSTGFLAPETMGSLLTIQEYKDASRAERQADDRKAVDELFARADLDDDGLLSMEELAADRALKMAQALDDGAEAPQHMFVVRAANGIEGKFDKQDIMVGRRGVDVLDAVPLEDHPDLAQMLQRLKADPNVSEPDTTAEPEPDVPIADMLSETVRSAELTEVLIARLIQTLERSVEQARLFDDVA